MITFEFDRAKMRWKLALYTLLPITYVVLVTLLYHWTVFSIGEKGWAGIIVIMAAFIVSAGFLACMKWAGILGRGLRHHGSALVVNKLGIVDNVTDYTLGQFNWSEIKAVYPWDWTTYLFGDRWRKMPVISRQRGLVIVLKDGVDVQARLQNKSWVRKYAFKEDFKTGRKVWLFVPEILLDTPADEVMRRLNEFYMAQVRTN